MIADNYTISTFCSPPKLSKPNSFICHFRVDYNLNMNHMKDVQFIRLRPCSSVGDNVVGGQCVCVCDGMCARYVHVCVCVF